VNQERRLRVVATVAVVGLVLGLSISLVNGAVLHLRYPADTFLFDAADRFGDYRNIVAHQRGGDPYGTPLHMVYPPFMAVPARALLALPMAVGLLLVSAALLMSLLALFSRATAGLRSVSFRGTALVGLIGSYPVLFALDRGNFEIIVFLFFAGFLWCLHSGRSWPAAVLLSVAIALKGSPLPFAGLFVIRRQWRQLALCLSLTLGWTFTGLQILHPPATVALKSFLRNLGYYSNIYVSGQDGWTYGHSLYGGIRGVANLIGGPDTREAVSKALAEPFLLLGSISLIAVFAFLALRSGPLWLRTTQATAALLLLSPVSADYRLLLMLAPLALFLAESDELPFDRWVAVAFGVVLVPKTVNVAFGLFGRHFGLVVGAILGPVALISLLVATSRRSTHSAGVDGRGGGPLEPLQFGRRDHDGSDTECQGARVSG
jgi:hypothetical protein